MRSWRQENKRGKEEKREENPVERQEGGGGKESICSSFLRDASENWDDCVFKKMKDNLEIQKLTLYEALLEIIFGKLSNI